MCQRLMLAGNAFHHIGRDRAGLVRAIVPIRNDLVTIKVATDGSDELFYEVRGATPGAKAVTYPESEILHVRGRADSQGDGLVGQSILSAAREALGLSLATQKHGSRLFKNGARPGGVLVSPQALSPTAQQNLQKSWDANASGENAHRTAVLEGGVTYQQLGLSAEDSQFLETRKYQWAEIAAFFRIAPHKVGNLEKATYTNIEQQSSEYVTDTLIPWGGRIEARLKVALLTPDEIDQGYHFKFLWDGLLRGDTKSRMEAYALAIQNLILSPNEARERESLIPYEGGDDFKNPAITPKATGGDPDQSQDQGGQA
jgi:HK97 family phage portal protein